MASRERGKDIESSDHGRRPADRHARDRLAVVHSHRFRADVQPAAASRDICSGPWRRRSSLRWSRSYVLSRTLVNTMARYLLAGQAAPTMAKPRRRPAIPSRCFNAASKSGSRRSVSSISGFSPPLSAARGLFVAGFMIVVAVVFRAHAVPRPKFLPAGRKHANRDPCPRPDGNPHRGDVTLRWTGSRTRYER